MSNDVFANAMIRDMPASENHQRVILYSVLTGLQCNQDHYINSLDPIA